MFNSELRRGSLELLVLSVLDGSPRHGYEIGKLLSYRSDGKLEFSVSTLYSILYRIEDRGWIRGRWIERSGERRRRRYALTSEGQQALAECRAEWRAFASVVNQVIGYANA